MYTLDTILEKLRQHKPELQQKYPISQMGVFGSYARGEDTENSDIDIAVELDGLSFDDFSSHFLVIEACLYNIQIIGEAAAQLPEDVKIDYPNIPWALINLQSIHSKLISEGR